MRKLSIGATFGQAYSLTFGNLGLFARVAAVPFGLILAMNLALILFANPPKDWMVIAQNILTIIIEVPLLTSWHRFALLPRSQALPTMGFVFTPREVRFFGYLLLISATFMLPLMAVGAAGPRLSPGVAFAFFLVMVVLLLLWARLGLVFPAAAVGDRVRLVDSWQLSRGNGWRIFWLLILISLPFFGATLVVATIVSGIVMATKDTSAFGILSIPMLFLTILFAGIYSATLSIVYRDLADYDPATFTPA